MFEKWQVEEGRRVSVEVGFSTEELEVAEQVFKLCEKWGPMFCRASEAGSYDVMFNFELALIAECRKLDPTHIITALEKLPEYGERYRVTYYMLESVLL